jgi:hypothetical protein
VDQGRIRAVADASMVQIGTLVDSSTEPQPGTSTDTSPEPVTQCADVFPRAEAERDALPTQNPSCVSDEECSWFAWNSDCEQLGCVWPPSIFSGELSGLTLGCGNPYDALGLGVCSEQEQLACEWSSPCAPPLVVPLNCIEGQCVPQKNAMPCTWEAYRASRADLEFLDCGEYSRGPSIPPVPVPLEGFKEQSDDCFDRALEQCRPAFVRNWEIGYDSAEVTVRVVAPNGTGCQQLRFHQATGYTYPQGSSVARCETESDAGTVCTLESFCRFARQYVPLEDIRPPESSGILDAGLDAKDAN